MLSVNRSCPTPLVSLTIAVLSHYIRSNEMTLPGPGEVSDIRAVYTDTSKNWSDVYTRLHGLDVSAFFEVEGFCDLGEFCDSEENRNKMTTALSDIKTRLDREIGYRNDIDTFLNEDLAGLIDSASISGITTFGEDYHHIRELLDVPEESDKEIAMKAVEIFKTFVHLASLSVEELAPVTEVFDAFVDIGLEVSRGEDGAEELDVLDRKTAQLWADFSDKFITAKFNLGLVFNLIVSDETKIETIGWKISQAEPGWTWNSTDSSRITRKLRNVFTAYFYQTLLPVVYPDIVYMPDVDFTTPECYCACAADHDFPESWGEVPDNDFWAGQVSDTPGYIVYTVKKHGDYSEEAYPPDYVDDQNRQRNVLDELLGDQYSDINLPCQRFFTRRPFNYQVPETWSRICRRCAWLVGKGCPGY